MKNKPWVWGVVATVIALPVYFLNQHNWIGAVAIGVMAIAALSFSIWQLKHPRVPAPNRHALKVELSWDVVLLALVSFNLFNYHDMFNWLLIFVFAVDVLIDLMRLKRTPKQN